MLIINILILFSRTFWLGIIFKENYESTENKTIIINEVLASNLGIEDDADRQKLTFDEKDRYSVLGVVKGIKVPSEENVEPRVYFPSSPGGAEFIISKKLNQKVRRDDVLKVIGNVSSKYSIMYFEEDLSNLSFHYLLNQYISAITSVVISCLTIFISTIGLLGVISYSVRIRRVEIGIRMSLGAKSKDLIRLIFTDSMRPFFYGVAAFILFLVISFLIVNHEISNYYSFETLMASFISFLSVSVTLFLACYIPLRRYINLPPIKNLNSY